MSNLEQRLRELSKDQFESFVQQYLVATFPGVDIKRVEGAGGDAGVDSFSGLLASGPAIWQSKHFPNRIKQTQKRQVLKSIKAAFKENAPSLWTLCVPINLRTAEHRWFQSSIVEVYGGPNQVKLLQASDFLTELLHNRNLRDAFFRDNAISDMLDLRKVAMRTEGHNPEQMGRLTTEFAQQFLEGTLSIEPRLQAVVTFGGEPRMRLAAKQPDLIMSISQGEHTTHFFARDPKTFNLDPIRVSIKTAREEHTALKEAVDTGRPLTLQPGKVLRLDSSSSVITLKPAIRYQFKSGQRDWPKT